MKSSVIAMRFDQIKKANKTAFAHHAPECRLLHSTIEEKEVRNDMKRPYLLFLEKTIYDLGPDVFTILGENSTVKEFLGARRYIVFVVKETVSAICYEVEPRAQGIVERFVARAWSRYDLAQY